MSKNLQKILAGALATVSAMSIATPVLAATTDIPTLYQNAYDAMRKAEQDETQASINEARILINELIKIGKENNDEHLISDGSTWSSMVDKVQHPKLEKAVNAILKAQETKKQEDINEAYNSVEPNLPDHWKLDYTGTIDVVQQELNMGAYDAAVAAQDAAKKVIESRTEEDLQLAEKALEKAKSLVESLATSVDPSSLKWAKDVISPMVEEINLDTIKLYVQAHNAIGTAQEAAKKVIESKDEADLESAKKSLEEAKKLVEELAKSDKEHADELSKVLEAINLDSIKLYIQAHNATVTAQEAAKKVIESKDEADLESAKKSLEEAKKLVEELVASDKEHADELSKILEAIDLGAIKLYQLDVTDVKITQTGVSVTFDKLTETLNNVTLKVKDNKGNIVAVETINKILVGKTEANFNFTNYLKERPTGAWTVNGVEVDLTETNFVSDVIAAAKEDKDIEDKVNLLKVLQSEEYKGLVTFNKDNIVNYVKAICDKSGDLTTISDIQKLIDTTDANSNDTADAQQLIEMAKNNKVTNKQFENALLSANIDRVNSDWIAEYREAVKTSKSTLEAIQEVVDNKNENKIVNELQKNPIKNEEITTIMDLIDNYMNDEKVEKKEITKKACMKAAIEIQSALVDVVNSTSVNQFKNNIDSLNNLVKEFNKLELEQTYVTVDSVNGNLIEDYIEAISDAKISKVKDLNDLVNNTNEVKIAKAIEDVTKALSVNLTEGKFTENQKSEIKKAFEQLEKVTTHKENTKTETNKFNCLIVDMDNLEKYHNINGQTVDALVKSINNTNTGEITTELEAVKNAQTSEDLLAALKNNVLKLDNVKEKNIEHYLVEDLDTTNANTLKTSITEVNQKVDVLNAKDRPTILTALKAFADSQKIDSFNSLSVANKEDAAEEMLKVEYTGDITILDVRQQVDKAAGAVKTNIGNINAALVELAQDRDGIMTLDENQQSAIERLRTALKNITGENISTDLADKFYGNSLQTDKDGKVTVKTYRSYTEVRAALK